MLNTLFGKPISYWIELNRRFETNSPTDTSHLLSEIAELRGKVSFYESRVKEMNSRIKL